MSRRVARVHPDVLSLLAFAVYDDVITIDALLHVKRDSAANEATLRSRA